MRFSFLNKTVFLVKWIVMHLQDVDPEAFFWVGGWVGVAIRWSPVLWLNLQMAGRREMRWYVFLFFLNLKQSGRNFPPFQKKEADEEMMIEIEDVMMKHKFLWGGLFGEADFFLHFYKKVEFLILQPMFLWYPVILLMVGKVVCFVLNIVCEVQNEEDETLLDPYMIPKDFGIFEVIESSDSTTDAWIFTNPVELDGTFHFERKVSSRVGNCSLQFLWDASWYYQRRPMCWRCVVILMVLFASLVLN